MRWMLAVLLLPAAFVLWVVAVAATPMYAGRSARTCDNCHVTPNEWKNPDLAERKCSMSCQTCHVDPAGGGMRNVVGRYFGNSTLPMIATSPRPTDDWDRNAPLVGRRDVATTYTDDLPLGPNAYDDVPAFRGVVDDPWAWGRPFGGASRYALWDGRYGELNADPLLRVGLDLRLAALYAGNLLRFPMQMDVPAAVTPFTTSRYSSTRACAGA